MGWELYLWLSAGSQGPKPLGHYLLPATTVLVLSKKLDQKQSQDLNQGTALWDQLLQMVALTATQDPCPHPHHILSSWKTEILSVWSGAIHCMQPSRRESLQSTCRESLLEIIPPHLSEV